MNILTDILSLIRRGVFTKLAEKDDVIVLGKWNETPDMTGVASPIPYKAVKLIKVSDFKIAAEHCDHANSPLVPTGDTAGVYQKTVSDETTEECTVYFRTLKSLSSNLTLAVSTDDDYVEITTEGEPNTAANVGTGAGVWKNKVDETLNFKSLASGCNISMAETENEITISATTTSLPYTSYVQILTQNGSAEPTGPVLENTASITITWAYNSSGLYTATYSTSLPDINKAAVSCSQTTKSSPGGVIVGITASSTTGFNLICKDTGGVGIDSQLLGAVLEIRIYP